MRFKSWLSLVCALVTLLAVGAADAACSGNVCTTQAESMSLCTAQQTAQYSGSGHSPSTPCGAFAVSGGSWNPTLQCYTENGKITLNGLYGLSFWYWCSVTCDADQQVGDSSTQWPFAAPGSEDCEDGCYYQFHQSPGLTSLCFTSTAQCMSQGYYSATGSKCISNDTDPPVVPAAPPPKPCGGGSCYDPTHGFCAVTESGEQICTGDDPQPGKCIVGATGAMCLGDTSTPPPAPPDPPIPPGQPPSNTDTATTGTADGSGNVTNNTTTVNNFNGTATSQGGGTGTSTDDGVAGSSNTDGSGNSGSNGTDDSGKCPDGSVPTASGCSATFSDTGCDTPPAVFGDAIMAGMSRELWALKCAKIKGDDWFQKEAETEADPGPVSGMGSAVSDVTVGDGSFDQSGLGWGTACPSNPTFVIFGKTYTMDLANMCHIMSVCGSVLLIISCLVGLRIVSGGIK